MSAPASTRSTTITEAARRAGIPTDERHFLPFGERFAKVDRETRDLCGPDRLGRVIHITSMTPGSAGSGKTLTAIGLTDAINGLLEADSSERRAMFTLRQPSQGPTLGKKGGACGGGRSQILSAEDINLQFTGDFAAVTQAHNAVWAALMCETYSARRASSPHLERLDWTRCVDLCDRSLRRFHLAPDGRGGKGMSPLEGQTVITAASEIMAILGMAVDDRDLESRLGRVLLGTQPGGEPITITDLDIVGGLSVLLRLAIHPNLVQTSGGSLGFMHTGPFANIAHGNSSVISLRLARRLADYVITEGGFGADLGAQKFHDLVLPVAGGGVDLHVVVVSLRDLHHHAGGGTSSASIELGVANVTRHVEHLRGYGAPLVITINTFEQDAGVDLRDAAALLRERTGCPVILHSAYRDGAEGAAGLARAVLETMEVAVASEPASHPGPGGALDAQAVDIACRAYQAAGVHWTETAREELEIVERLHRRAGSPGPLRVCMSKTPFSLSDDASLLGVPPRDRPVTVTGVILMNGAGWVTLLLGSVHRMPGMELAGSGLRRLELRTDARSFGGCSIGLRDP